MDQPIVNQVAGVVYHTSKYTKKDGTVSEYKKGYIPKPRLNENVQLERKINKHIKDYKNMKQTQKLKDILHFIEQDLNVS
jgi:hypothetical protein